MLFRSGDYAGVRKAPMKQDRQISFSGACLLSPIQGPMRSRKLLCFGRDAYLLETRLRVLSRSYTAQGVTSLSEMMRLDAEEFDLVLLCHSLLSDERDAAAGYVRERWPKAKLLGMFGLTFERNDNQMDAEVQALDGPRVLLRTIDGLLGEPSPA